MNWRRLLISGTISGSLACGTVNIPQRADGAAGMLFDGYETVAKADVSTLPFEILGRQEEPRAWLFMPFGFLFAALDATGTRAAERAMSQTEIVLAGMKDFRPPEGLGSVSSRNCYVLIVKRGFDLASVVGKPTSEQWEGWPVWRWTAKLGEFGEQDDRPSTLVALQMWPYVLISNDPDSIFANAAALKRKTPPAVLNTLREWKDVAQRKYWVYRRFRFDTPHAMAAGLTGIRKDAESLVLFYDSAPPLAKVRLTSRDPVAKRPESLDEYGALPPLTPVSDRAWEGQLPLSPGSTQFEAWFIVFGHLGFVVYL